MCPPTRQTRRISLKTASVSGHDANHMSRINDVERLVRKGQSCRVHYE